MLDWGLRILLEACGMHLRGLNMMRFADLKSWTFQIIANGFGPGGK